MPREKSSRPAPRRKLPRSFKDLTPAKHFNPRTFFQELILKAWFTPRTGRDVYKRQLVIMALATTAMCGPLLRWWLPLDLKALVPRD